MQKRKKEEEKGKESSDMAGVTLGGIPIKAPVNKSRVKKRVTPTSNDS